MMYPRDGRDEARHRLDLFLGINWPQQGPSSSTRGMCDGSVSQSLNCSLSTSMNPLSVLMLLLQSGIKFIAVPPSKVRQSAASSPGKSLNAEHRLQPLVCKEADRTHGHNLYVSDRETDEKAPYPPLLHD